jgi:hypothetical protein
MMEWQKERWRENFLPHCDNHPFIMPEIYLFYVYTFVGVDARAKSERAEHR